MEIICVGHGSKRSGVLEALKAEGLAARTNGIFAPRLAA